MPICTFKNIFNKIKCFNSISANSLLIILLSSIIFLSCKDEIQQEEKLAINQNATYGDSLVQFPKFTTSANYQLLNWGVYTDFLQEVDQINRAKVSKLQNHAERLVIFADSMGNVVPDTLKTMQILTRIKVVNTRARVLDQNIKKSVLDSTSLINAIAELNRASINLIDEINYKFKKDDIDFQQKEGEASELKKQQKFLDSVNIAELKDLKKN